MQVVVKALKMQQMTSKSGYQKRTVDLNKTMCVMGAGEGGRGLEGRSGGEWVPKFKLVIKHLFANQVPYYFRH